MEIAVLLGLLGFGLIASVIGGSDSDDSSTEVTPEPEEPIDPDLGDAFAYDGSPSIVGTDGDDTLNHLGYRPEDLALMEQTFQIDGGLGNDYIEGGTDAGVEASISGGEGNDTLISTGSGTEFNGGPGDDVIEILYNDTAYGGAGDDTISSYLGSTIDAGAGDDVVIAGLSDQVSGGEGNDNISISIVSPHSPSPAMVDGGMGDDTLNVKADISDQKYGVTDVEVTGGEGNDTVNLELLLNIINEDVSVDTSASSGITLNDFDSSEDTLVIDITMSPEEVIHEMTSAEIVDNSYEDQGETISQFDLELTFGATETRGAHTVTIRLGPDVNLNVDDIIFVQN